MYGKLSERPVNRIKTAVQCTSTVAIGVYIYSIDLARLRPSSLWIEMFKLMGIIQGVSRSDFKRLVSSGHQRQGQTGNYKEQIKQVDVGKSQAFFAVVRREKREKQVEKRDCLLVARIAVVKNTCINTVKGWWWCGRTKNGWKDENCCI